MVRVHAGPCMNSSYHRSTSPKDGRDDRHAVFVPEMHESWLAMFQDGDSLKDQVPTRRRKNLVRALFTSHARCEDSGLFGLFEVASGSQRPHALRQPWRPYGKGRDIFLGTPPRAWVIYLFDVD